MYTVTVDDDRRAVIVGDNSALGFQTAAEARARAMNTCPRGYSVLWLQAAVDNAIIETEDATYDRHN